VSLLASARRAAFPLGSRAPLLLRCELDASFFYFFGFSREDAEYLMDTFPIARKNDEEGARRVR
jgi:hypothetical protein